MSETLFSGTFSSTGFGIEKQSILGKNFLRLSLIEFFYIVSSLKPLSCSRHYSRYDSGVKCLNPSEKSLKIQEKSGKKFLNSYPVSF